MRRKVNCIQWKIAVSVVVFGVLSGAVFAQSGEAEVVAEGPDWTVSVAVAADSSSTLYRVSLVRKETEFAVAMFFYDQVETLSAKGMQFGVTLSGEWFLESLSLRLVDGEVLNIPFPLSGQQHDTMDWRVVTRAATSLVIVIGQRDIDIIDTILLHESDVLARVRYAKYGMEFDFDFTIPWAFWSEVAAIQ